jgi:hypothetical protein
MPPRPELLVCPSCATPHSVDERFCRECGMPLVHAAVVGGDDVPVSALHERVRKIKPQLSEGPLTKVSGAHNQAEAEWIQGLLLEEGVPSMLRRSAGFDVPDMLAAGPRDVLVPRSGAQVAREVLLQAEVVPGADAAAPGRRQDGRDSAQRVLAGLLSALVLVAVIAWIGTELLV